MDKYICSCCGGKINRITMTCEYCGTQYEEKHDNLIRIETFRNPVVTLQNEFVFNNDLMDHLTPQEISKLAMDKTVRELAECIAPYIEVQIENDPMRCQKIMRSRIKIVQPVHTEWRL